MWVSVTLSGGGCGFLRPCCGFLRPCCCLSVVVPHPLGCSLPKRFVGMTSHALSWHGVTHPVIFLYPASSIEYQLLTAMLCSDSLFLNGYVLFVKRQYIPLEPSGVREYSMSSKCLRYDIKSAPTRYLYTLALDLRLLASHFSF